MYCPRVKKIHQNIKLMHKAVAYWLNTLLIIQKSRVQTLLALRERKCHKSTMSSQGKYKDFGAALRNWITKCTLA